MKQPLQFCADEMCPACRTLITPHAELTAMLEIVTHAWWHGEYLNDATLTLALLECATYQSDNLPQLQSN